MKQCPTCKQVYSDDTQSFCLNDGSLLTFAGEQETKVRQLPKRRKGRIALLLGIMGLLVLAGCGLVAWLFLNNRPGENANAATNREVAVSANNNPRSQSTAIPASTSTPTATANSLDTESSPKKEEVDNQPSDKDAQDATPINWETTTTGFKGEEGQTYSFLCPEKGTVQNIYGSEVYTGDSSICTAAVHAGIITLEDGGIITLEIRPGRLIYGSTTQNGVTSNTYGEHYRSFIVR